MVASGAGVAPAAGGTVGAIGTGLLSVVGVAYLFVEYGPLSSVALEHEKVFAEARILQEIKDLAPPQTQEEADSLNAQVTRTCRGLVDSARCASGGIHIYVPGGAKYNGNGNMPQTGAHIHKVLVTDPQDLGLDAKAVQGDWGYLHYSQGGAIAIANGFGGQWYDLAAWKPNACENRVGTTTPVCDEFPFKTTDAVGNRRGPVASLSRVPQAEAGIQGTDVGQFYSQCLADAPLDYASADGKPFIVISPPLTYIQALGQSAGFELKITGGQVTLEQCLG